MIYLCLTALRRPILHSSLRRLEVMGIEAFAIAS